MKLNPYLKEGNIIKSELLQSVEFKTVSFSYPDHKEKVIKELNLSINKGESVAIVGASGSGKTTLIDLLMGFYPVSEGSITIDDVDVNDLSRKSLTQLMALVTQSPVLFNDTVINNIQFGESFTFEAVVEAAKIAYAHDFIMQLPKGYETNIGDSGVKLSGGQRQRLTLARAILRNPPILILDEATSALDSESEKWVQLALEKMLKKRTAIIIAHRLSTIKNVDRIIVMNEGRIVEMGTHQELVDHNGHYRNFVMAQNLLM